MSTSNVQPKKGPPDLMVMLGAGKKEAAPAPLPGGQADDPGSSFVCPACGEKMTVESAKDETAEDAGQGGEMSMGAGQE